MIFLILAPAIAQRARLRPTGSGEILCPHPIGPAGDDDLGMLAIADISMKDRIAILPAHAGARRPDDLRLAGWRRRAPRSLLTGLARLTRGQPVSPGHIISP